MSGAMRGHGQDCACCGKPVEGPVSDFGCQLPDVAFEKYKSRAALPRSQGVVDGNICIYQGRFYIYALVAVSCDVCDEFRFGVWVDVGHIRDKVTWGKFLKYVDTFDSPEYMTQDFVGVLANYLALFPEAKGKRVWFKPKKNDAKPYVYNCDDPEMKEAIMNGWTREQYEAALKVLMP